MTKKISIVILITCCWFQCLYAMTTLRDNQLYFDTGILIEDTLDTNLNDTLPSDVCFESNDFESCSTTTYYDYIDDLNVDLGTINVSTFLNDGEVEKVLKVLVGYVDDDTTVITSTDNALYDGYSLEGFKLSIKESLASRETVTPESAYVLNALQGGKDLYAESIWMHYSAKSNMLNIGAYNSTEITNEPIGGIPLLINTTKGSNDTERDVYFVDSANIRDPSIIDSSEARVGILTTSPTSSLDVDGNMYVNDIHGANIVADVAEVVESASVDTPVTVIDETQIYDYSGTGKYLDASKQIRYNHLVNKKTLSDDQLKLSNTAMWVDSAIYDQAIIIANLKFDWITFPDGETKYYFFAYASNAKMIPGSDETELGVSATDFDGCVMYGQSAEDGEWVADTNQSYTQKYYEALYDDPYDYVSISDENGRGARGRSNSIGFFPTTGSTFYDLPPMTFYISVKNGHATTTIQNSEVYIYFCVVSANDSEDTTGVNLSFSARQSAYMMAFKDLNL